MKKILEIIWTWILNPCKFEHNWGGGKGGNFTNSTRKITGLLPGEQLLVSNGIPTIFRRERHCRDCYRKEYLKNEVEWTEIPIKK